MTSRERERETERLGIIFNYVANREDNIDVSMLSSKLRSRING
jgi:hypothetical protein